MCVRVNAAIIVVVLVFAGFIALQAAPANAQVVVPGPADSGRVRPEAPNFTPTPERTAPAITKENLPAPVNAPQGAEAIRFTLSSVQLNGVTAFGDDAFATLYAPLVGTTISLKTVYEMAASITRTYRDAGYLLSYATVPDQEIADGTVTIAVVEGHIARVIVDGVDPNRSLSTDYMDRITAEKPLNEKTLESALLRLNDLPGTSYRAVLSKDARAKAGASTLTLIPSAKAARASISVDNFTSRFLGPHEVNANYSRSLAPRHQTTIFGLTSIPFEKLNYLSLSHSYALAPALTVEGGVSYTASTPGFTLKQLDIESSTRNYNLGLNYQLVRQRDENLLLKFGAQSRSVASDILGTALTRDEIRTLNVGASYDSRDSFGGANVLNATLTQALGVLGATGRGASNPSRAQADDDFTKLELAASRLQSIDADWSTLVQLSGQMATGPLYASEEFGYGGQTYGRAYDASEIVGDAGAQAAIELRYTGVRTGQPINVEPFAFYDYGFVTNRDTAQVRFDSRSSVGGGARFVTGAGQAGMLALAVPVSTRPNTPIYGSDSTRVLFQVSHNF